MVITSRTVDRTSVAVLNVPAAVARLSSPSTAPDRHVLSIYLSTTPARIRGQAYWLAYRDGCRSVRHTLLEADKGSFEESASRAERYLVEEFNAHHPGLALFVDGRQLIVVPLPEAPLEAVAWGARPEIAPLQAVLDNHERVAVVLFDAQHTRLFTIFLGQIESHQAFEDRVPSKQATGGWFALEQARFERHRLDHLRRHAQHTVRMLMDVLREHSFDRLLLAGPAEPLVALRRELPRPLHLRLSGTLGVELSASDSDVLKAVLAAAEGIERQDEQQQVDELLDSATARHVVLGVAGTLRALAEGGVHTLVVCRDLEAAGGICQACDRLVAERARCPACRAATTPVANLLEPIVQHALAQGANVQTVAGPAAERLRGCGGVGAWTRFRFNAERRRSHHKVA